MDLHNGNIYLGRRGRTIFHLSDSDNDTFLRGPYEKAPSSSPSSSTAAANGVYGRLLIN